MATSVTMTGLGSCSRIAPVATSTASPSPAVATLAVASAAPSLATRVPTATVRLAKPAFDTVTANEASRAAASVQGVVQLPPSDEVAVAPSGVDCTDTRSVIPRSKVAQPPSAAAATAKPKTDNRIPRPPRQEA